MTQYGQRLPGTRLVPLVAEIGGRWHYSVPRLVRQLAKATAARSSARGQDYAAAIAARWGARLSALLIRGNAAVQRKARVEFPLAARRRVLVRARLCRRVRERRVSGCL